MANSNDNNNPSFNNSINNGNSIPKFLLRPPVPNNPLAEFLGIKNVPDLPSDDKETKKPDTNGVITPSRETSINQINFNEQTMTPEAFEDLILEDIGGRELLTLSRHDSLIGITAPKYSPIKNISATLLANSPINIAPNPNSTIDFFDTFSILLSSYIPTDTELNALDAGYKKYYLYYEPSTNSFIINASNIFNNEGVEVEFITFSSLNDDTIYT